MRSVRHEVIGPDVVAVRRPLTHARSVREPEPPAFGLFLRHFETFTAPEPRYPLVIDAPAFTPEQRRDAPIAVASVGTRQGNEP